MAQLTFSSNVYWKICFKFCILEQIIVTVLFICISSINNKRSSLRFQSTTAPTNGGWSACDLLGCTANEALSRSSKFRSPKIESFLMVLNKLFSKLRMFWSKLCKSGWNCMEPCVSCIYLTYCMEYVWKSSLWIGIFQRATQRARILLTDNIQNGGSCSVFFYGN